MPEDHDIKFVLLGASGVGKSSLFRRLMNNTFSYEPESTLGAAYVQLYVAEGPEGRLRLARTLDAAHGAHRTWRVHLWDTAGQERYRSLLPMYYRGANVVAVVHDGTKSAVQSALTSLDDVQAGDVSPGAVLAVCQSKSDLPGATPERTLANDARVACSGMVSALTGEGVEQLFLQACRRCIDQRTRAFAVMHKRSPVRLARRDSASRCCA